MTLSSHENGLVGLLKANHSNFLFNIAYPCHGVSLSLRHSFETLPDEIVKFVDEINSYFAYSQHKAELRRVQEEADMDVQLPKKYVKTRWLSLGQSLQRILRI